MDFTPSSIPFIIFMSIISSVSLILVNKYLMQEYKFTFIWTLTTCHFIITHLGLAVFGNYFKGFVPKGFPTISELWLVSFMGVGSIVFNNFSLKTNSVGLYQIFKLCCIPVMVVLQSSFYGARFSDRVKGSLVLLLTGVSIVTVTDITFNLTGFIWGCLAVFSTTQYQTWQGTKQKEHNLSGIQITHHVSRYQAIITSTIAMACEILFIVNNNSIDGTSSSSSGLLQHHFTLFEIILIGVTCMLALSVNVCSYALIGKTSAVTYQVVGHAKTCLILIGGYLMSNTTPTGKNCIGIAIAITGVVLYGYFKNQDKELEARQYTSTTASGSATASGGYSKILEEQNEKLGDIETIQLVAGSAASPIKKRNVHL